MQLCMSLTSNWVVQINKLKNIYIRVCVCFNMYVCVCIISFTLGISAQ